MDECLCTVEIQPNGIEDLADSLSEMTQPSMHHCQNHHFIVQIVVDEDDVVGQEQFGGDQCGQMSASSVHQCQSRSRSRDLAGKYLKPQSIPRYWSLSRRYLFEKK